MEHFLMTYTVSITLQSTITTHYLVDIFTSLPRSFISSPTGIKALMLAVLPHPLLHTTTTSVVKIVLHLTIIIPVTIPKAKFTAVRPFAPVFQMQMWCILHDKRSWNSCKNSPRSPPEGTAACPWGHHWGSVSSSAPAHFHNPAARSPSVSPGEQRRRTVLVGHLI